MASTAAHTAPRTGSVTTAGRLQYFPVTLFSSVMGIGGLSLAWRRASTVWDLPTWPSYLLLGIGTAVFLVLAGCYLLKWVRHSEAATAEVRHPVKMSFVPTVTIAMLLLATGARDVVPTIAGVAWWIGAVGHLALTIYALSSWFGRSDIQLTHVTPAWFIPIVGNVITPMAAAEIGSVELAWFTFGVGVMFWLALLPVVMTRILLHEQPLPEKLLPTLAIFIAPPSVAALSWLTLTDASPDPVARVLYAAALFFAVMVLAQLPRLRRVPFAIPYWAYTFPSAALTVIAVAMAGVLPGAAYDVIAVVLLAGTTLLVLLVGALTLRAAARRRICVPD